MLYIREHRAKTASVERGSMLLHNARLESLKKEDAHNCYQ